VALDKRTLTTAMDGHLTSGELSAVLARRDLIVELFRESAARKATRGEWSAIACCFETNESNDCGTSFQSAESQYLGPLERFW